jgi:hypothetical protein
MIPDEARDPILIGLGRLGTLTPDPTRSERARARCRIALARRELRRARTIRSWSGVRHTIEPALVAGFCLMYLSAMIYDVLLQRALK